MRSVQLVSAKLYRDVNYDDDWIAWYANIGWVRLLARPRGRAARKPAAKLDALHLQTVSLAQAFSTGLVETFQD